MQRRLTNIFNPPPLKCIDHWLLLHAPMLWRTRLLQFLLLLGLLQLFTVPVLLSYIEHPQEISYTFDTDIASLWLIQLVGAMTVIAVWIRRVMRMPVGELPIRRHVVTVLAVFIGSYLWLVAPSLFAYFDIKTIEKVGPDSETMNKDLVFLSRNDRWKCIPESVWMVENKFQVDLKTLRATYQRYNKDADFKIVKKTTCSDSNAKGLIDSHSTDSYTSAYIDRYNTADKIISIQDARNFWIDTYDEGKFADMLNARDPWVPSYSANKKNQNQFSNIRTSFIALLYLACFISFITVIFSYPRYVWRRRFFSTLMIIKRPLTH